MTWTIRTNKCRCGCEASEHIVSGKVGNATMDLRYRKLENAQAARAMLQYGADPATVMDLMTGEAPREWSRRVA